jgi:hypothetical protein
MADNVALDFKIEGAIFEDLRKLGDAVKGVGQANKQAQESIQAELKDSAQQTQQFSRVMADASKVVVGLGKAVAGAKTDVFVKSIQDADRATSSLEDSVRGLETAAADASDEMQTIGSTAKATAEQGKTGIKAMGDQAARSTQQIGAAAKLSAEQYAAIREEVRAAGIESEELTQAIAATVAELAEAGVTAEDFVDELEPAVGSVESLQRQLRAAKREAGELAAEFGLDSEQALAAQQRVAALTDEVGDLAARFDAFNPDKKFEAFNQLQFSLVSGLTAVQSSVQLLAGENEGLSRAIFGFQSLLFATQSLQQFVGGFGDALKTLRATLGLTTAATTAQAGASTAAAGATGAAGAAAAASTTGFAAATAAVKAFTISLLTNPIFLVVAALAALGVAVLASGDDAEKAKAKWDDLFDTLERFRNIGDRTIDLRRQLDQLEVARERISVADGDFETQKRLVQDAANAEIAAIRDKAQARLTDAASLQAALDEAIRIGDLEEEDIKERQDRINGIREEASTAYSEQLVVRRQAENELAEINKQALDQARQNAQARKALVEELIQAERELTRRVSEAQRERLSETDPLARVQLERQAAQEEINELERGFARKLASIELQKRIGPQKWAELSELEKEARADALIQGGDITLPAQQQEQINKLRLIAEQRYLDAIDTLYREQAALRVDIMAEGTEKERAVFLEGLTDRADELRKAGIDELEIRAFVQRERETFERQAALNAIELDQQLQEARLNATVNTGENERIFEQRKQLQLLAIQEAATRAKLAQIVDDGTKERQLQRAQLEATLADIGRSRQQILDNPVRLNILDLLGIREQDQQQVRQDLASIFNTVQQFVRDINAAKQAEVDAQINATDAIIADQQRRRSELTSLLEAELQAQREGYANNADAIRAELESVNAAEKAAVDQRKVLMEEQKALARQQVAIDSAIQVSALITANARLLEKGALAGIPGIISAIAFGVSLLATFANIRARVQAANQPPQFEDGGEIGGRLHSEGGTIIEAERGEYITNRKSTAKYKPLIEAINEDDFTRLRLPDIRPLIEGLGIRLEEDAVRQYIADRRNDSAGSVLATAISTKALEEKVQVLTDEVKALRRDRSKQERVSIMPDGTRITERPGQRVIIRPKKKL